MKVVLVVRPAGEKTSAECEKSCDSGEGAVKEESLAGIRVCVCGGGWLELVDDLILCRVGLIFLHLRQQLQGLLYFLCRAVARIEAPPVPSTRQRLTAKMM
jgi:hypothetical protein